MFRKNFVSHGHRGPAQGVVREGRPRSGCPYAVEYPRLVRPRTFFLNTHTHTHAHFGLF
jgi:hypothetical protein